MIIDTTQPGNCRSCGARVYWRTERSGKSNPYDPPSKCGPCFGEGIVTVPDLLGGQSSPCTRCDGRGTIQVSHYSSCPQASDWRRKAQ